MASIAGTGAGLDTARGVVAASTTRPKRRAIVAWLRQGGVLTDTSTAPPAVQDLVRYLIEAGARLPHTRCPGCGKPGRLRALGPEGRVCVGCWRRTHVETCRSCRRPRWVSWRDPDGWAWCGPCRRDHPDREKPCGICGTRGPVAISADGHVVGHCCYRTPVETCVGCGQARPVWARRDEGPHCRPCSRVLVARCVHCGELGRIARVRTRGRVGWCVRCVGLPVLEPAEPVQVGGLAARVASSAGTSPPACAGCGRVRRITAYLPDGPRCGSCYDTAMGRAEECSRCHERRRVFFTPGICAGCLGVSIGGVCAACGAEDRLYSAGRCVRCELRVRVSELFEDAGEPGRAVVGLLTSSSNPKATLQWLARSSAAPILVEHVRSERVPSHADLDAIAVPVNSDGRAPHRQAVEFARAILVAAGVLPSRHDLVSRYEMWAHRALKGIDRAGDRWTLQRYHLQQLLPAVQRRCETGKATSSTVRRAQERLRSAAKFLAWAEDCGGLEALDRAAVDEWFSGLAGCREARMFLLWAIGQHLVGLPASAVPSPRADSPAETEDHSVRAALARRLLHGDDAPPDIRVAGLLVVLFGQHLSRIVRLERAAARTDPPAIKLGRDWLDLPDPMGQHLKDLVNARSPGTTVFGGDHWLFPGQRPGSHLSEASLARRLGEYGISARAMRNAALFHLASIVQPHTLSRLLGLHPNTAVAWVNLAGGIYARYWQRLIDDDLAAGDDDYLESDGDLDEDRPEGDPLDILDELGLSGDSAF